jgi:hypothetical protein
MRKRNSLGKNVHSVAFKVTDKEWEALSRVAQSYDLSIPQLTRALLFKHCRLQCEIELVQKQSSPKKR